MTVAIDSSTEDVSCLSRSLAALGIGSGGRLRRARSAASSEKTDVGEKRKSSLDSAAPSITSTAVEPADSDVAEVKPWIPNEELARARHKTRSTQDAIYIKIRYGSNETEWRVYPTTRVARLKRSYAYRYAREMGPDALQFNFDSAKMKDDSRIRDYNFEDGDIIDVYPDFSRMHGG